MEFVFRAELKFEDVPGIAFDRFLPIADQQPPVNLGQTGFRVAVGMDLKEHRGWVTDVDPHDFGRHCGLRCHGIFILIWADLAPEVAEAVTAGRTDAETRQLGERLLGAIEAVHDALVDLVRNEQQQIQLEPRRTVSPSLQQRLMAYDTRWQVPEGWKIFCAERDILSFESELTRGINPEDWDRLKSALQRGKFRVRPHRVLLANAFAHLEKHDFRAAIIEGVAAWEMIMNGEAVRRLAELHVSYEESDWRNLIEKAGLRASTRLFIALARDLHELTKRRDEVIEAIDLRNNVVHNGQQRIDGARTKQLLRSIRAAAFACEDKTTTDQVPVAG